MKKDRRIQGKYNTEGTKISHAVQLSTDHKFKDVVMH